MGKFTFRPGKRAPGEGVPLLVGLVGPSGSGKTYSALRIAQGIQSVVGGKLVAIDTEARRMLHYEDKFRFDYTEFGPPFSSVRYADVLEDAAEFGARTIVIDSMSHEHEGAGGYLEFHEEELDRMVGQNADFKRREAMNFRAWIKPAAGRRKLINKLLQINANFVFCFRAKEKLALVRNKEGKTEPVPLGWQAIAGEEFGFEMTARCLLTPGCNGVPDWSEGAQQHGVPKRIEAHREILKPGRQLDEAVGRELALWARKGAGAAEAEERQGTAADDLFAKAKGNAAHGMVALRTFWDALPRSEKKVLQGRLDELKAVANDADKADATDAGDPFADTRPKNGSAEEGAPAS